MIERRTIEELVTRYELEQELSDVYVEGPWDQTLIEWVASESGLDGVVAYEINTVDVPAALVADANEEIGHRGRVVALARELERRSTVDLYHTAAGFVDADLGHFQGGLPMGRLLIVTDFTSTELYMFTPEAVDKFLRLVLGIRGPSGRSVLEAILPVLAELFMIRLAAKRLGVALALVDFERDCTSKAGKVEFDRLAYVARFIRRDGFAAKYDAFVAEVAELHTRPIHEPRHVVHGHDFINVLRWYARTVLRATVPSGDDCARALRGCLEYKSLANSHLVRELQQRFA